MSFDASALIQTGVAGSGTLIHLRPLKRPAKWSGPDCAAGPTLKTQTSFWPKMTACALGSSAGSGETRIAYPGSGTDRHACPFQRIAPVPSGTEPQKSHTLLAVLAP